MLTSETNLDIFKVRTNRATGNVLQSVNHKRGHPVYKVKDMSQFKIVHHSMKVIVQFSLFSPNINKIYTPRIPSILI